MIKLYGFNAAAHDCMDRREFNDPSDLMTYLDKEYVSTYTYEIYFEAPWQRNIFNAQVLWPSAEIHTYLAS